MRIDKKHLFKFVEGKIDKVSFKRIRIDNIEKFANKLACLYAKQYKVNYYDVQPLILACLRRLRCRPEYYRVKAMTEHGRTVVDE
jgi:hypothetical protein